MFGDLPSIDNIEVRYMKTWYREMKNVVPVTLLLEGRIIRTQSSNLQFMQ